MQEQQSTINQDSSSWIGLDSYKESNSGIFFGRDEEIRQLSSDIFNNIQTVIYGPSGTGKTSIIRAGIFKIARANRYIPVYVRLNHNTGSKAYTQQIIDAIQDEAEKYNIDIENTSPYIKENVCQSLWEYFHCNEFWNEENYPVIPLIVVDQFEEIFTLGKNISLQPDFFSQLSDLCDNKYPQYVIDYLNDRKNDRIEYPEAINYRIVFSLREDYLARLEEQAETIPSLKRNRFSLQCINEEQALDIILKPQPGLVSKDVAALIIEKVTNKKYNVDFKFYDDPKILVEPAILSIFCRELDQKRRENGMPTLSSDLIGEFGDNIIRDYYIKSLSSLSDGNEENHSPLPTQDEKIDYLESRLITVDGFRDAVAYQNAIAFGFTKNDIKTLVDNRLVRIDEWDGTKRIEFIHDVLCKVANKHQKEREQEKENKKKEEEAKRIEEENKQIKMQNDRLNKIRSLFLSEKAISCNRDRYLAQMLALEALPIDIERPDKPLVPQAEKALRKSIRVPYCPMIGHKDIITRVIMTTEGTQVLSLSRDGRICIWDVFSGAQLKEFNCGANSISTIAIRNDGSKMKMVCSNGEVQLYSFDDSKEIEVFKLAGAITALAISPDGTKSAIGLEGGNVMIRPLGQKMAHTQSNIKTTNVLMFSPNGEELIALGEGCLDYCSVKTWEWKNLDQEIIYAISCVSYSRNGKYLFCGTENGKIIILESCSGKRKKKGIIECENTDCRINTISISSDTKKIVYSIGGKLITLECDPRYDWSPQKTKEQGMEYQTIKTYLMNDEYAPIITSVAWSPDNRYVVWGNTEGMVSLYDTKPGPQQRVLLKAASYMKAFEYSPNGENIICLSDHNTIRMIEIESGKLLSKVFHANDNTIGKELLSPDGKYRAVRNKVQHVLELYENNKQKAKYVFAFEGEATSISFSSDSNLLALATNNGNVICWDTNNGENKYYLKGNRSIYNTVLFSPKGRIVATTASNREVFVGDEESGITNFVIPADNGYVFALAFSPDGKRLVVGMETGAIRIWNVATKEQVDVLEINQDGVCVRCLSFSPDGEHLFASYSDGSVIVWECPSLKALIKNVRQQLRLRKFTDDEKRRFYLEDSY